MANEDQEKQASLCSTDNDKCNTKTGLFGSKSKGCCSTKGRRNSCSTGNCPSGSCSNNNTMLIIVIAAVMLFIAYRNKSDTQDVALEAATTTQEVVSVDAQTIQATPES